MTSCEKIWDIAEDNHGVTSSALARSVGMPPAALVSMAIGDLWWYSAMIFVACRSGDAINAFIGLWLVPREKVEVGGRGRQRRAIFHYTHNCPIPYFTNALAHNKTKHLHCRPRPTFSTFFTAVLPLQQLTSFLTVPLGVVAIVFSKQVNTYAAHGEYGKVKGFIRDVLAISAVLFVVCIAGAYLIMPFFYERLKIASGLLTALILASGFVGSIGSLVGAAQQGLKREIFSGYILGQTGEKVEVEGQGREKKNLLCRPRPTFSTFFTALAPYAPDTSWRKDWKSILGYTWPIAA